MGMAEFKPQETTNERSTMEFVYDSATEARARAKIYAFLAEVFSSHPTQDALRVVRQIALALGISFPNNFSLTELDLEYMELFVVSSPRYVAPYESVFHDQWILQDFQNAGKNLALIGKRSLAMEETSIEVRRVYIKMGVFPDKDLPDHIANELSFMAYLWLREAEASTEKIKALSELRNKFCEGHLLTWMGLLRERVMKGEHLGFYSVVLQITEVLLQDENRWA